MKRSAVKSVLSAVAGALCAAVCAFALDTGGPVWTLDLAAKTIKSPSPVAVSENARITVKPIGESRPEDLYILFSDRKDGTPLASADGLSFSASSDYPDGAQCVVMLNTVEIQKRLVDKPKYGEIDALVTLWDTNMMRMLAQDFVPVLNNPFVTNWTSTNIVYPTNETDWASALLALQQSYTNLSENVRDRVWPAIEDNHAWATNETTSLWIALGEEIERANRQEDELTNSLSAATGDIGVLSNAFWGFATNTYPADKAAASEALSNEVARLDAANAGISSNLAGVADAFNAFTNETYPSDIGAINGRLDAITNLSGIDDFIVFYGDETAEYANFPPSNGVIQVTNVMPASRSGDFVLLSAYGEDAEGISNRFTSVGNSINRMQSELLVVEGLITGDTNISTLSNFFSTLYWASNQVVSNTAALRNIASNEYVKSTGDTMTGPLVLNSTLALGGDAISSWGDLTNSLDEAVQENAEALEALAEEVAAHPTNSFRLSATMEEQTCLMDLFEVTFTPRLSTVGTTGEVVQAKSIMASPVLSSNWAGYLLSADIQAAKSETNEVVYRSLFNGTLSTNDFGEVFWHVDGGGAFGNLRATFGEASRMYLNVPALTNGSVERTGYVYAADTPGSLRAGFNAMTNAVAEGAERCWTNGAGTNFLFGMNWTFDCIGQGLGDHPFQATLVTPRHAIVAGHCAPPVGTEFRWTWNDGAATKKAAVEKRRSASGDRCVVFLDDYVGAPTALLLDGPAASSLNMPVPEDASGIPGLYVASFHKGANASVSRIAADLGRDASSVGYLPATNALPSEVAGVPYVGGDSSSPVFLLPPDTNRPVLAGCAWYTLGPANGGGGPNWASADSWRFLTNAIAEMDREWGQATFLPERYGLAGWPEYSDAPTPTPAPEEP